MVVFAIILAIAYDNQGIGVIFNSDATGNIFEFPAPITPVVLPRRRCS